MNKNKEMNTLNGINFGVGKGTHSSVTFITIGYSKSKKTKTCLLRDLYIPIFL